MNKGTKKLILYGGGILVVLVVLFALGRGATPPADNNTGSSTLRQNASAPDFTLKGIDGQSYTLSSYRGNKAVLLEFLAVWCPHCQNQTKTNKTVIADNRDKDIVFLGVNASADGRGRLTGISSPMTEEDLVWYRDQYDVAEPLLFDKGAIGQKYGLTGFPMFVLVDKEGKVRWSHSGEASAELIQAQIDKVFEENIVPADSGTDGQDENASEEPLL